MSLWRSHCDVGDGRVNEIGSLAGLEPLYKYFCP